MALSLRSPTNLTKEQLDRLNMLVPDALREQWKQIPEIVEKPSISTSSSDGTSWISNTADFFGNIGIGVGNAFSEFGLNIQATLTSLVVTVIVLLVLYFLLRLVFQRRCCCSRRTKHNESFQQYRLYTDAGVSKV